MKVLLFDQLLEKEVTAIISRIVSLKELPFKKGGWQFNWRELFKSNASALFYKITLSETPNKIEGLLMVSVELEEMVFMNNIEVSSQNLGGKGRYGKVAGCLLAYACSTSFLLGWGDYEGYLSFQSKSALIELYMEKYGATLLFGHNMCFEPAVGKTLIEKYLGLDYRLKFE